MGTEKEYKRDQEATRKVASGGLKPLNPMNEYKRDQVWNESDSEKGASNVLMIEDTSQP